MSEDSWLSMMLLWLQDKSTEELLNNVKAINEIMSVFIGLLIAISGVFFGILPYIKTLRQKQCDEDFSYLSQLRVRLQYIRKILIDFRLDMTQSILVLNGREIDANRIALVHSMRDNLANFSTETLKYLSDTRDQYPAGRGWSECLTELIEWLFVCENIATRNRDYYIWTNETELSAREFQYDKNLQNISSMIALIVKRQKKIECKLFYPWERIKHRK